MKWLIYFLLICNIGFVAWHYRGVSTPNIAVKDMSINHENQLILLSEYKQETKEPQGSKLCYSLGPFYTKEQSKSTLALFKENKVEIKQIQLRDTSLSGYWVTLPVSESRKAAINHIIRLKKLKVTDYFLVATGPFQNAVSLGVFSQKKLARRRVDDIIRLGFVPRMERVPLPRKVYWLNWYKDSKEQLEYSLLTETKKKYPQISKIERSCK